MSRIKVDDLKPQALSDEDVARVTGGATAGALDLNQSAFMTGIGATITKTKHDTAKNVTNF